MPRCFALGLVAAALAHAAQAHAEALLLAEEQASSGPRTRVLLGRRGGGGASGASEVAPASFAEVLDGKSSQDEEKPQEIPMETATKKAPGMEAQHEDKRISRTRSKDAEDFQEIPMGTNEIVSDERAPGTEAPGTEAPGTEAPGPKAPEEATEANAEPTQAPVEATQAPVKATEANAEPTQALVDEIQDQDVEEDRSRSSRSSVLSKPVDSPPGNVSPDRRSVNEVGSDDE